MIKSSDLVSERKTKQPKTKSKFTYTTNRESVGERRARRERER